MNRQHRPGRILLVEDDENDLILTRRAFARSGLDCDLCVVRDGREAEAYLGGEGAYADRGASPLPDLVLLDLKLGGKSGFEVLEWMRGREDLRHLPVVVLTSSKGAADLRRAYDLGANSYLVKPVGFGHLQELVRGLGFYWLRLNHAPEAGERA